MEPDTPANVVEESKNHLLSMIQDRMNSCRYTSDSVEQIIFTSDQDGISSGGIETVSDSTDQAISTRAQTSTQSSSNDKEDSDFPVCGIIASIISFVVIVVAIFFVTYIARETEAFYRSEQEESRLCHLRRVWKKKFQQARTISAGWRVAALRVAMV